MFISWMMAALALAKLYTSNSQYQVPCHNIQEGLEAIFLLPIFVCRIGK